MTLEALAIVAGIIVSVWAALLGTAYGVRVAGWSRNASLAAVTACYLVLTVGALLWLGLTTRGWLGVAGMLAPYAMAMALAVFVRPRIDGPRA